MTYRKFSTSFLFLIIFMACLVPIARLFAQEQPLEHHITGADFAPQAAYNMEFVTDIGAGSWSGWDVAVQGDYAYIADTEAGLRIVDISNPAHPVQVGTYADPSALFVSVFGNYAYLGAAQLHIIDITNPTNPVKVGIYDQNVSAAVIIRNNLVYMSTYDALEILNVSNPASPQLVGSTAINGTVYGIDVVGNYAYLADGGPFDDYCGLRVVDVSNPADPTLKGSSPNLNGTICEGVAVTGNYAYVTTWDAGIFTLDVSNAVNPTIINQFYTDDIVRGITIANDDYAYAVGYRNFVFNASSLPAFDTVGYYDFPDGHGRDVAVAGDYIYTIKQYGELAILRYEIPKPTLTINYSTGAPGSYFTLNGENFPENSTAAVSVNGRSLGTTPVDSNGRFSFLLTTTNADEGAYFATASVNPSATTQFVLGASEPLREQEGSGDTFNVPAGIAFNQFVYLPAILR